MDGEVGELHIAPYHQRYCSDIRQCGFRQLGAGLAGGVFLGETGASIEGGVWTSGEVLRIVKFMKHTNYRLFLFILPIY